MRYEQMKPDEIDAVIHRRPVAYIPWGALEWHGRHNPVGLDGLKAHHLCLALCEATGGVVLPPVYAGHQTLKPWRGFGHCVEISRSLVRQLVAEHLENLYEDGFRVLVIVMGHFGAGHIEAVQAGCADFAERHCYPKVWAFADWEPASWVDVKAGDHAGIHETSLMMHFQPDLVNLPQLGDRPLEYAADGCPANARQATAEHGAELARIFVEQAATRVQTLLDEANAAWPAAWPPPP